MAATLSLVVDKKLDAAFVWMHRRGHLPDKWALDYIWQVMDADDDWTRLQAKKAYVNVIGGSGGQATTVNRPQATVPTVAVY